MLGLYVADIFVSQAGCEMSFTVSDGGDGDGAFRNG